MANPPHLAYPAWRRNLLPFPSAATGESWVEESLFDGRLLRITVTYHDGYDLSAMLAGAPLGLRASMAIMHRMTSDFHPELLVRPDRWQITLDVVGRRPPAVRRLHDETVTERGVVPARVSWLKERALVFLTASVL